MARQNKYRIHMSSLKSDERSELKDKIDSLKGAIDDNMTFFTRYLICPSVDNMKHRVDYA